MAMQPQYFTAIDDTLRHQVRFLIHNSDVHISCVCRKVKSNRSAGPYSFASMGQTSDIEDSRRLYNDPSNHKDPFNEEDEAKW